MRLLLILFPIWCCAGINLEDYEYKMRGSHPIHISEEFVIKKSRGTKKDNQEILREGYILEYLNRVGCKSCPQLIEMGVSAKGVAFLVIEYIPPTNRLTRKQIIESYIEQKNLGVYQGDPCRSNMRFLNGRCILIDYGLAQINPKFIHTSNKEFIKLFSDKIPSK